MENACCVQAWEVLVASRLGCGLRLEGDGVSEGLGRVGALHAHPD